jgi:hypothetical protein
MLRRSVSVVSIFVLLARAAGQDAGTNSGTNQPVAPNISTNLAPVRNFETSQPPPGADLQLQDQNALTNEMAASPSQPAPLGPATLGSTQPAAPLMGTSVIAGAPDAFADVQLGPGIPLWGPIDIHPRYNETLSYGNGIEAKPGQPSKTAINTINPAFLLDVGENITIDYGPAFTYYSNPQFKNTTDEFVTLRAGWSNETWTLLLSQGYVESTEPLIETGVQTAQESYVTALNASYQMGSSFSLQLNLNQSIRNTESLTQLHEWTTSDWLNYQAGTMFGMGIGVILGYDKIDPGSDMPFEQLQGRITYRPGAKLSLAVSGGVEDRQFVGPSAPSSISPVFKATLQYKIFQATTINLGAGETVTPSLFANQIEVSTTVNAAIDQKLARNIFLDGSAGYSTTPLTSIEPGPLPQYFFGAAPQSALTEVRNDNTTFFKISVTWRPVDRIALSAFYSLTDNSSGQASFAYSSHQAGLSLKYRY